MAAWEATFLPEGHPPAPGDPVALPDHARTLTAIAADPDRFYRGDLAETIAAASAADGGWLTAADLAAHQPAWDAPLAVPYRGLTLHELPPNGQGLAALIALGVLQRLPLDRWPLDGPDTVHAQLEAMKLAFAAAKTVVAEPDALPRPPAELLDDVHLDALAARLDMTRAQDPGHEPPRYSSTVYLAAGDAAGTMVSLIQSNFEGFGSGVVVPGTGIALHNRGRGFVLDPTHPNAVGPGKRPYHTIIPGFVTCDGDPLLAFGVMGGPMQPQGHLQVICRLADHGQNPQAALDAPRWRLGPGRVVHVEPGWPAATLDALARRGHQLDADWRRHVRFGGGQAVLRLPSGAYLGASDLRREGQAVAI